MRVVRGKIRLAAFDGPSPKTPLMTQKSCRYLLQRLSYSQFCPKIRCHGNGDQSGVNINDAVKFADPENHTLEPKITTLSYT